jgi:alpha-mannosidase
VPQDRFTPRIDQGERLFRFWLNAGPTDERLAAIDREALVRNEQPMALSFFPSGDGTKPGPFVTLSDKVVQLAALKRSEDGQRLIIRLFEPTGRKRSTTLALPSLGLKTKVSLGPFEIKTLALDPECGTWTETNLMEEPLP